MLKSLVVIFCLLVPGTVQAQGSADWRQTYVIVHGAWGGTWDWRAVDSLLSSAGHRVYLPQLTGQGKRVHLTSPQIGLTTHIDDVGNEILWEDLHDVILIGHSYGGMIVTGVADRMPERIREVIYIDAFVPESGESVLDLGAPRLRQFVTANSRDGMIPPPGSAPQSVPRDVPQPLKTFSDRLTLTGRAARVPGKYVLTVEKGVQPDDFQPFADRASARGWPVREIEGPHVIERTNPTDLVRLLLSM